MGLPSKFSQQLLIIAICILPCDVAFSGTGLETRHTLVNAGAIFGAQFYRWYDNFLLTNYTKGTMYLKHSNIFYDVSSI